MRIHIWKNLECMVPINYHAHWCGLRNLRRVESINDSDVVNNQKGSHIEAVGGIILSNLLNYDP